VAIGLLICLFGAEGLGQVVVPAFLILQNLLSAGCSLLQFKHLSYRHWVCATLQVSQVWLCS
jgi:hypothetical protein